MRLQVTTTVNAPVDDVWAALVDWEAQEDWMLDARDVSVVSPHRVGEGVTIHVPTSLLGVPVLDVMRITGWDPPRRLEATHLGTVIRGVGAFELAARRADVTDVVWWEDVVAPFGPVGEWGARVLRPVLRAVFASSLRRFRDHVEAGAARA